MLVFTHTKSFTQASTQTNGTVKKCIAHERSALLTFRVGLSDPTDRLSSWEGSNCCQWKGVQCSNTTGHVVKLDLQGPDLNCDVQALRGKISSSLIGLQHLQYLDLSCNRFNKEQIPEFLGSLHGLRYLDLSQLSFVGRIPPQLGNLSNLRYLNLDSIWGNTHSTDITWLSRLSSLQHLDMSWVNLSTITNWVSVVNKLPSLVSLDLSLCELSTSPDSLLHSNLTSLESLSISDNNFHKRIAPWFWDLRSLKQLDVSYNQLHGPFPYELGNMTSLVHLDLSVNNLVGMIPSNLKNLCNLEDLNLSGNNINGSITEFFNRLPSCSWNKLKTLFLPNSNLTGSLPAKLEPFRNLTRLYLSSNMLTGPVPLWVGQLTNLAELELSSNNLDGALHKGHLSGLVNLEKLSLSDNSIAIRVNSTWVPLFNLTELELRSCLLGPKFPTWLRWQINIYNLDISNTSISDMVPDWF
ncbi:receptor-like protein EIX1 [Panicum virgatum]|uniref:receptor-like protein EIX1 n=1 Tax=Panicum virgatum TaxID=38727 RepID=UPI0019D56CD3|nr:receptor-like protein EIX1 [Panicum virgatum]